MNALYLTLFVSFVIALLGVLLFIYSVGQRDHSHADRLSLLPLEDDASSTPATPVEDRPSTEEDPCAK